MHFSTLLVLILIARSNYLRNRGDYRGAFKLACLHFSFMFLADILWNKYTVSPQGVAQLLTRALMLSLFWGSLAWLAYFAFEPYVRRRWPTALISWSRVMTGRLRDALVGRDMLIGILGGIIAFFPFSLRDLITGFRSEAFPGSWNASFSLSSLLGGHMTGGILMYVCGLSIYLAVEWLFYLFLLRILLRRQWLTIGVSTVFLASVIYPVSDMPIISFPLGVASASALVFLGVRFGLVAMMFGWLAVAMLYGFPVILSFSWYASTGVFAVVTLLSLAIYGFYTSLGGQKVFAGKLLDE